jgi:hypothetical protein
MYVKLGSDTYLTLCFRYEFIWNISKPNYFIYINFKSLLVLPMKQYFI